MIRDGGVKGRKRRGGEDEREKDRGGGGGGHRTEGNKPEPHQTDTDGHILCDSTHMRSLEESHLQTQGIDGGVF